MHRMYDLSGAGEGAGGGGGGASPAKNIDQLDGGGGIGGEEIRGKGGGIRGGGGEIRGKRGGIGAGSSDPSQPKVAARLSQLLFRSTQGCVSDVSPMQAPSPGWQSVASGHTAPPPTWAAVSVQARSFAASHSAVHSDQDPSQSASLWANEYRFVGANPTPTGIFRVTVADTVPGRQHRHQFPSTKQAAIGPNPFLLTVSWRRENSYWQRALAELRMHIFCAEPSSCSQTPSAVGESKQV